MNTAIILAAGKGNRMKSGINKQYINLKGRPILSYTLEVFFSCDSIEEIIAVINPKDEEYFNAVLNEFELNKSVKMVFGGDERQQSVQKGLERIGDSADIIVIHDGARPFITCKMIEDCIAGAKRYAAVTVGVPVKETIKAVDEEGFISDTLNRESIWIAQTPQAFKRDIIVQAHTMAQIDKRTATDDAMLVEYLNYNVKMIPGEYNNIKITTKEDLIIAESIIEQCKRELAGGKNV